MLYPQYRVQISQFNSPINEIETISGRVSGNTHRASVYPTYLGLGVSLMSSFGRASKS